MWTRLSLTALLTALSLAPSPGAQRQLGGIQYSTALPMGYTKEFTDSFSWLGMTLEGRRFVKESMSVGLMLGVNTFHQNVTGTIDLENGALTGAQYRNFNMFPMMLTLHLYGGSPRGRRFYIGTGVGAYYIHQLLDVGIYTLTSDDWHFGVAPEAGFLLPFGGGTYGNISVRYHYPVAAGDYLGGGSKSPQYWSFSIGVLSGR